MGPGSAEQREERCAASGTRRFSGCCVPRMLRSAPHFAAWCAADPGSIYLNPNGSRHSPGRRVERRSLTCDPSRCGTSLWLTDLTRRANHIGNYRPLCPASFEKKYSVFPKTQINLYSSPSCSTQRGVSRTSRTRGGVRWTWRRADDVACSRTAKTCGPDASVPASSWRINPHSDGGKKADHRGEHGISRKPLRGECRMIPVNSL
jgi:hypothetical protein